MAATGLTSSSVTCPTAELDAWSWRELVTSVQLHRLPGLFASLVHEERFPASLDQRNEAAQLQAEAASVCLRLEDDLLRVAALLEGAGIDLRVLKGPSFAHLDYPDPALRFFGDIDLLVRSEDFDRAGSVLRDAGYERRYREVRAGFDRRFGKGACFVDANRREIDLHRTFVMGPFGLTVDLDEIWSATDTFAVRGTVLHRARSRSPVPACLLPCRPRQA